MDLKDQTRPLRLQIFFTPNKKHQLAVSSTRIIESKYPKGKKENITKRPKNKNQFITKIQALNFSDMEKY